MVDVRHPGTRAANSSKPKPSGYFSSTGWRLNENEKFHIRPRVNWLKWGLSVLLIVIVSSVIGYGAYLWTHRDEVAKSITGIYEGFKSLKTQVLSLQTNDASASLKKISDDVNNLRNLTTVLNQAPVLRQIPQAFTEVNQLIAKASALNDAVTEFKAKGVGLLFKGNNGRFLQILRDSKKNIDDIKGIAADLRDKVNGLDISSLVQASTTDYLAFNDEIDRISAGLGALISLLSQPGDVHFAVPLENPSEIRPAGGFDGSYADIVFTGGEISAINVQDIYYPQHFSTTKIIPPFQLQTITTNWGVQDATWFFDFPTTARKFIEFIESSSVYKDNGIRFEGDIAVNVRLIEDIIKVIGPIELPQYNLTLTSQNFLKQVQEEVEAGVDKKPGQNPKKILSTITPILLDRVKNLTADQKDQLLNALIARLQNKDIKFYFKNKDLESVAVNYGVAGDVFDIPGGWNGDYLAVVNANVAGGKSDAHIRQEVKLSSTITADGEIQNILDVTRTHTGQNQPESWYRATDQNFIKIFTPARTKLTDANGGGTKTIKPAIDYKKAGYATDPDLAAIENTASDLSEFTMTGYSEDNKAVFATWESIPAGKSKTIELSYTDSRNLVLSSGLKYTFVLDKQSGVESDFKYTIQAPEGYIWQESKSAIFSYENTALPARLVLQLTLQKTNQ